MEFIAVPGIIGDDTVELIIYKDSKSDYLDQISDLEVERWGESKVQLQENCSYHYVISEGFQLDEVPKIIIPYSRPDNNRGLLRPGNYTGTMTITGRSISEPIRTGDFQLEIRSVKTDYRTEYRLMLEEIAEYSIDLILQHSSPIIQSIAPNYELDHRSLYQKFAFINTIIGTEDFFEAINRIARSPVTTWSVTEVSSDIRKMRNFSKKSLSQFASSRRRVTVPHDLQTQIELSSLPSRVTHEIKTDSIDTPENQFIKHVLTEYYLVCDVIKGRLNKGSRERAEAENLTNRLRNVISQASFREISRPRTLALNSPVLQKKEGYREVFKSWLMFDLGSKLTWTGGDDVFIAGKKDVARLYEYWIFFKLLSIISRVFPNFSDCFSELIRPSDNGLDLNLRSGSSNPIQRLCKYETREIMVEFSYNQTFSGSNTDNYPKKGSWTRAMRPDYTLSFWPNGFSKDEAELQELIVHIHFDAKYRIENITQAFGSDDNNLIEVAGDEEEVRDFKRLDLIKMHAYKDAIRRTAGAYILYPGTENRIWRGYHEIIPGLGAFTIRPSRGNEGSSEIQEFLRKIVGQLLNRASKFEETTYHIFETQSSPSITIREPLPEEYGGKRAKPPTDVRCLIGYFKNDKQKMWIDENGLYNIRTKANEEETEHAEVDYNFFGLTYLLLHGKGDLETNLLYNITDMNPKFVSKKDLIALGYSAPKHDQYLLFSVSPCDDDAFRGVSWDLKQLKGFPASRSSSQPFVTTLAKLMKARVKELTA